MRRYGKISVAVMVAAMIFSGGLGLLPGSAAAAPTKTLAAGKAKRIAKAARPVAKTAKVVAKKGAASPNPSAKKVAAGRSVATASPGGKKGGSTAVRQASAKRAATTGRCEPQSLTYARARSGIMRSRSGRENGPLTWFSSETRLGKTSEVPLPGSVLILGADTRHGMPTGHVAYVEQVRPDGPSRYKITFSHTNYDRRCSMETDIEALYDSSAMTMDIFSGAWQAWGKGLRVAGFIHE